MDKLIATVDCTFQWFQLWKIASDNVTPVTFTKHLLLFISTVYIINIEYIVYNVCVQRTLIIIFPSFIMVHQKLIGICDCRKYGVRILLVRK